MPRNQPRSSRGRSAVARRVINTNSTNGMMYQGTCVTSDGIKIAPCHNFGGMKKGGAHPSATGFMRARPWQMSVSATNKNYLFNMRYFSKPSSLDTIESLAKTESNDKIVSLENTDTCALKCSFSSNSSGCIMTNPDVSLCCATEYIHDDNGTIGCTNASFVCGIGTDVSLCGRNVSACDFSLTPEVAASNVKEYLVDISKAGLIVNYPRAPSTVAGVTTDGYKAYGPDPTSTFVDAVYAWNTFIHENNKKTCTTIAYNNYGGEEGTRIPVQCERTTFPSSKNAFAGELDSLFDSSDKDLNKIELALILSNAWNETGDASGLFNNCLQKNTPGYDSNTCPNDTTKYSYNNILAGRGLLQLSNPDNYIKVAHILNKMGSLRINNNKYNNIINGLPMGILYPQVCGESDISSCCTNGPSCSAVEVSCCVDIPTSDNILKLCSDISRADNIFTNPSIICTRQNTPLAVLSSLIYSAANSSSLVKKNNYSFLLSACSVNMGGVVYPVPDTEDNKWLEDKDLIPDDNFIKEYINGGGEGQDKWCTQPGHPPTCENCDERWIGFCTIMNILFPENNITGNSSWKIILDKYTYEGVPDEQDTWLGGAAMLVPRS